MKVRRGAANSRRKVIEVSTSRGTFVYPFARLKPRPSPSDPIRTIHVDRELGSEAVTYTLASGREGTVHIEQVLDYTRIPIICAIACCMR
jgi:hypothetical protein